MTLPRGSLAKQVHFACHDRWKVATQELAPGQRGPEDCIPPITTIRSWVE